MPEIASLVKVCRTCGVGKGPEAFPLRPKARDGLKGTCKACLTSQAATYRVENLEKVRERSRAWARSNRDVGRAWQRANPEKVALSTAKWREANPEKVREISRAWGLDNPEKVRGYQRAWQRSNPEKVRISNEAWQRANPDKVQRARLRRVADLKPCYVAQSLGLSVRAIPPALIDLKRLHIQINRYLKEIQNEKRA